jgi:malate dehydrogenase (oxaloacetate-decarboxylating)(NADP+)
VIRAAYAFVRPGLGTAMLVGREERVHENMRRRRHRAWPRPSSRSTTRACRSATPSLCRVPLRAAAARGFCAATCQRLVNQDRNYFAACMVALGDADAMVTGVTRNFSIALWRRCSRVIDPSPATASIGVSLVLARGRTVFIADTASPKCRRRGTGRDRHRGGGRGAPARAMSRAWRCCPSPPSAIRRASARSAVQEAVRHSRRPQRVDFEYDGEMAADVALNPELWRLSVHAG